MYERLSKAEPIGTQIASLPSRLSKIETMDGKGKSYYVGFMPNDLFDAHHWLCENHQDAIKLMEQLTRRTNAKRGKDYGTKQTMVYMILEKE